MTPKESYRHILPHFQQPGQAYFVTWCIKDAVPPKALIRYTCALEGIRALIELHISQNSNQAVLSEIETKYRLVRRKYIQAFDNLLAMKTKNGIDLSNPELTMIVANTLHFWEGKKIENFAFCVMPNHIHWVFKVLEKDGNGNPVYLQDILYSVKRFSANQINIHENRKGELWQKESFDTTIRDEKHLYSTIEYTLNNPVAAGLVKERHNWKGSWFK
jgi:putative transposase